MSKNSAARWIQDFVVCINILLKLIEILNTTDFWLVAKNILTVLFMLFSSLANSLCDRCDAQIRL